MSVTILTKEHTQLRVRAKALPATTVVLGNGIDVTTLPEGHMVCTKCQKHLFEAWMYGDSRRIEVGCMECGESYRLLLPMDVKLGGLARWGNKHDAVGEGRFTCKRHPDKGMVVIHNVDVLSIGCEKCKTELNICLRKAKGIVLASE